MRSRCIISHAHADQIVAKTLAMLIERTSLGQVKVWYSSDDRAAGGIGAGESWFDAIRTKLSAAKVVVALLSPSGLDRPWIYFEAGFGAASAEVVVIPVSIGLGENVDIPSPLNLYQSYQLSDHGSVSKFLEKLLARFEVKYDPEMCAPVVRGAISELSKILPSVKKPTSDRVLDAESLSALREHFDRRFFELLSQLRPDSDRSSYNIPFRFEFAGVEDCLLDMTASTSVQDVLDECWSHISDHVEPFKYLDRWVAEEERTGRWVVIREFAEQIPAQIVFKVGSSWVVRPLEEPYSGEHGSSRVKKYYRILDT